MYLADKLIQVLIQGIVKILIFDKMAPSQKENQYFSKNFQPFSNPLIY